MIHQLSYILLDLAFEEYPFFVGVRDLKTLRDDPVDNLILCPDHYFTAIHDYLVKQVRVLSGIRLLMLSEID